VEVNRCDSTQVIAALDNRPPEDEESEWLPFDARVQFHSDTTPVGAAKVALIKPPGSGNWHGSPAGTVPATRSNILA